MAVPVRRNYNKTHDKNFSAVKARYFRLLAMNNNSGDQDAGYAEIDLFTN